jgi:vacuolar-type H+-ATPase subunit F/Vma7
MSVPVFIGDEASASGYRLAGLQVRVPGADDVSAVLAAACEEAPLVLISADIARQLPEGEREHLLARVAPPVVVVPDVRGRAAPEDLATRLRRQLGVFE